jgi:hypothetical protein
MKKAVLLVMLIFVLVSSLCFLPLNQTSVSAYVAGRYEQHLCPTCDAPGYYTGQIKFEWGHTFWLYKCCNNHYWWERQN